MYSLEGLFWSRSVRVGQEVRLMMMVECLSRDWQTAFFTGWVRVRVRVWLHSDTVHHDTDTASVPR